MIEFKFFGSARVSTVRHADFVYLSTSLRFACLAASAHASCVIKLVEERCHVGLIESDFHDWSSQGTDYGRNLARFFQLRQPLHRWFSYRGLVNSGRYSDPTRGIRLLVTRMTFARFAAVEVGPVWAIFGSVVRAQNQRDFDRLSHRVSVQELADRVLSSLPVSDRLNDDADTEISVSYLWDERPGHWIWPPSASTLETYAEKIAAGQDYFPFGRSPIASMNGTTAPTEEMP
jgi:hypothetical protein